MDSTVYRLNYWLVKIIQSLNYDIDVVNTMSNIIKHCIRT